jgi:hypothetical protein
MTPVLHEWISSCFLVGDLLRLGSRHRNGTAAERCAHFREKETHRYRIHIYFKSRRNQMMDHKKKAGKPGQPAKATTAAESDEPGSPTAVACIGKSSPAGYPFKDTYAGRQW